MLDRKPYQRRFIAYSNWTFKAVSLVIAGAAMMIVALLIIKHVSIETGSALASKSSAGWHEGVDIPADAPDSAADVSPNTVMHNGLTVISPELLVPVIDLAALEGISKESASKASSTRKRSRYAKRSKAQRQTHWKAYGLAIR